MVAELGPGALAALLADDETADPYAAADALPPHLARPLRPPRRPARRRANSTRRRAAPPVPSWPFDMRATVEQAARALGVTPNTLRGWCRTGQLDGAELVRREWRIPWETIRAAAARSARSASGPQAAALVIDL
ncbi:helix-turn-helix domain-containing protein [Microbispora sp. CA-102843]|uniref:helix-turn-helix domain-containing protein n=1 Tax=Microbispora sp. CA-102843 TaxID=3239952 RepID=UPI003D91E6B6